jgi:hypothetical protein
MAPTRQQKDDDGKYMDLLAVIGQASRAAEAAQRARQNADIHGKELEEKLEKAKRLAVEIRDSKWVKDKDE